MIERLHVEGFRLLRHVDVPLRPLTVLVGANDSGKTSFLRSLQFFQGSSWAPQFAWRRDEAIWISVSVAGTFGDAGRLRGENAHPTDARRTGTR